MCKKLPLSREREIDACQWISFPMGFIRINYEPRFRKCFDLLEVNCVIIIPIMALLML